MSRQIPLVKYATFGSWRIRCTTIIRRNNTKNKTNFTKRNRSTDSCYLEDPETTLRTLQTEPDTIYIRPSAPQYPTLTTLAYGDTPERSLPGDFSPVGGRSIASNTPGGGVADPGAFIPGHVKYDLT